MENCTHLVISGGGFGGISIIGAIACLIDNNKWPTKLRAYSGCSVGAIFAVLLILDYTPSDLLDIIKTFPFASIDDWDFECFMQNYGIDKGERQQNILSDLVFNKTNVRDFTLKTFYEYTKKDLYISVTNVSQKKIDYLHHTTHPDLPLLLAIKMTTCIPLYFPRCIYNGEVFVDGGIKDNFPMTPFVSQKDVPLDAILGIKLSKTQTDGDNIISYISSIINCISSKADSVLDSVDESDTTPFILKMDIKYPLVSFDHSDDEVNELHDSGYASCYCHLMKPDAQTSTSGVKQV